MSKNTVFEKVNAPNPADAPPDMNRDTNKGYTAPASKGDAKVSADKLPPPKPPVEEKVDYDAFKKFQQQHANEGVSTRIPINPKTGREWNRADAGAETDPASPWFVAADYNPATKTAGASPAVVNDRPAEDRPSQPPSRETREVRVGDPVSRAAAQAYSQTPVGRQYVSIIEKYAKPVLIVSAIYVGWALYNQHYLATQRERYEFSGVEGRAHIGGPITGEPMRFGGGGGSFSSATAVGGSGGLMSAVGDLGVATIAGGKLFGQVTKQAGKTGRKLIEALAPSTNTTINTISGAFADLTSRIIRLGDDAVRADFADAENKIVPQLFVRALAAAGNVAVGAVRLGAAQIKLRKQIRTIEKMLGILTNLINVPTAAELLEQYPDTFTIVDTIIETMSNSNLDKRGKVAAISAAIMQVYGEVDVAKLDQAVIDILTLPDVPTQADGVAIYNTVFRNIRSIVIKESFAAKEAELKKQLEQYEKLKAEAEKAEQDSKKALEKINKERQTSEKGLNQTLTALQSISAEQTKKIIELTKDLAKSKETDKPSLVEEQIETQHANNNTADVNIKPPNEETITLKVPPPAKPNDTPEQTAEKIKQEVDAANHNPGAWSKVVTWFSNGITSIKNRLTRTTQENSKYLELIDKEMDTIDVQQQLVKDLQEESKDAEVDISGIQSGEVELEEVQPAAANKPTTTTTMSSANIPLLTPPPTQEGKLLDMPSIAKTQVPTDEEIEALLKEHEQMGPEKSKQANNPNILQMDEPAKAKSPLEVLMAPYEDLFLKRGSTKTKEKIDVNAAAETLQEKYKVLVDKIIGIFINDTNEAGKVAEALKHLIYVVDDNDFIPLKSYISIKLLKLGPTMSLIDVFNDSKNPLIYIPMLDKLRNAIKTGTYNGASVDNIFRMLDEAHAKKNKGYDDEGVYTYPGRNELLAYILNVLDENMITVGEASGLTGLLVQHTPVQDLPILLSAIKYEIKQRKAAGYTISFAGI